MRPEVEALLILQDRDQKIASLKNQRTAAPRERHSHETRLAAARDSLEESKMRVRENEQTRKNEEFQALTSEIQHAEDAIHALEDRELVLMEQAEELQRAAAATEKETARTEAIIKEQLARLEQSNAATTDRLRELEAEHVQLAEKVDSDALFLYERLFVKKGDAAVVPLEHEICGGCHMKVPTQVAAQVRGDQALTQCPNCGRILYREV
jgi:predicted  nucleic acid-binding Zn-ribbon protein